MKNSFELTLSSHGIPYPSKPITHDGFTRWGKNANYFAIRKGDAFIFGDWKKDTKHTFFLNQDDGKKLSKAEWEALMEEQRKQSLKHYSEQRIIQTDAASRAKKIWDKSTIASMKEDHPYLIRKNVNPYGTRIFKGSLVVPVMDIQRNIWSLQFILENGDKTFLKGGKTKECLYLMGAVDGNTKALTICEGFATAATLYEINNETVSNMPTICTFSAGNIEPVTRIFRNKHPSLMIIIAADNDQYKGKNTGLEAAEKAAARYRCKVIYPEFDLDKKGENNHAR